MYADHRIREDRKVVQDKWTPSNPSEHWFKRVKFDIFKIFRWNFFLVRAKSWMSIQWSKSLQTVGLIRWRWPRMGEPICHQCSLENCTHKHHQDKNPQKFSNLKAIMAISKCIFYCIVPRQMDFKICRCFLLKNYSVVGPTKCTEII